MTSFNKLSFWLLALLCVISLQAFAQRPSSMLEMGVHGGYFFISGDVQHKPGYAAGIHVRKATDYMFSLRLDALAGKAFGDNESANPVTNREYETTWFSGTAFLVATLNSFRFDQSARKFNLYGMIGAGGNSFISDFNNEDIRMGNLEHEIAAHAALGAGMSVRVSKRFNIGLEHQAIGLFGKRADRVDGSFKNGDAATPFRDIVQYAHLQLNFNIGSSVKRSEPLYWVNPLDKVLKDVADTKQRQDDYFKDSDGDGVPDFLDQEPNTIANAPVDTKGRTLDSDKDGVPDYKDKEPYNPPRPGEKVDADGVVINPINRGGGVTEDRVQEMIDEAISKLNLAGGGGAGGAIAEGFLPMIHFGVSSSTIKFSDYGNLASIGRIMKTNPNLRLVVSGHTDQTGDEQSNEALSYQRANAIIEHMMTSHGIGRGRFVLEWKGQSEALVPSSSSYMNRRVEFRAATAKDVEMDPPAGAKKKSGY